MGNPLLLEFLGAVARWVLTAAFSILLAKGVITEDQSSRFLEALTSPIAMAAVVGLVLQLVWSLRDKYWNRKKLVTAQAAPAGTTEQQIEQLAKDKDLHTPPPTLPKTRKPYDIMAKTEHPGHQAY